VISAKCTRPNEVLGLGITVTVATKNEKAQGACACSIRVPLWAVQNEKMGCRMRPWRRLGAN